MSMDLWPVYVAVAAVLAAFLALRVWLHFDDKRRIRRSAVFKGWRDVIVSWAPFAPGWVFEAQERHYRVRFKTDGSDEERYCKIRFLGEIYWQDRS